MQDKLPNILQIQRLSELLARAKFRQEIGRFILSSNTFQLEKFTEWMESGQLEEAVEFESISGINLSGE